MNIIKFCNKFHEIAEEESLEDTADDNPWESSLGESFQEKWEYTHPPKEEKVVVKLSKSEYSLIINVLNELLFGSSDSPLLQAFRNSVFKDKGSQIAKIIGHLKTQHGPDTF